MPDIFVNEQGDIGQPEVAKDIIEENPKTKPKNPPNPHDSLTNAQKHALRARDRDALPGHTHNVLASYFYYPDSVDFLNKDPEETVVLLVRRHPITNIPWIAMAFALIIAPGFVSVFPFFEGIPGNFQIVFSIVWYMITIAFILEKFLTWFFNVNIITDERIIDVDFINLVYRDISDADIDQIQDVTARVGGSIRTLFNYGDVVIQTAAEVPEIKFEAVPHPDQITKLLHELRLEEKEEALEGRVR